MYYQTLSDGYIVPQLGLGTYKLRGFDGVRRIEQALGMGYRLIDTAVNYDNEGVVGKAIRNSSVPRSEITVISKIPGRYHDYDSASKTIQESLLRMGLDYIDIYLIHWPNPKDDKYLEAWQALIDARSAGLVRSIGTSNFLPEHINRLEEETGVLPVVNQVELHPDYNQEEEMKYHTSKGIITQAWSPFNRGNTLADHKILQDLANKYNKSVYQIVIRWHLERGVNVIPKATSYKNQADNLDVFDFKLTSEEVSLINEISRPEGRRLERHPSTHSEY